MLGTGALEVIEDLVGFVGRPISRREERVQGVGREGVDVGGVHVEMAGCGGGALEEEEEGGLVISEIDGGEGRGKGELDGRLLLLIGLVGDLADFFGRRIFR